MKLYQEVRSFVSNFLNSQACVAYLAGYQTVNTLCIGIMFYEKFFSWNSEYQNDKIIFFFGLNYQYSSCFFRVRF